MPKTNFKIKLILPVIIFFAFFALAGSASAATYFVDGNLSADCASGNYSIANRACNGANGNAFNTITDVNSRLQAGDTAYIRAGTYSQQIKPVNSGTSETARITYARHNNETVNITHTGTQVYLTGKSYITIDGFVFTGGASVRSGEWVNADDSTGVTAKNCVFREGWNGFRASRATYLKVLNNKFENAPACQLEPGGSCPEDPFSTSNATFMLVEGNYFGKFSHGPWGTPGAQNDRWIFRNNDMNNGWHNNGGLGNTNPNGRFLLDNNIFRNAGDDCLNNPDGGWLDSDPTYVQDSWSDSCRKGSRFERTMDHVALQASFNLQNSIIRKNIFYNNGTAWTMYSDQRGPFRYNHIYNNVADQNERQIHMSDPAPAPGEDPMQPNENNYLKNNVFTRSTTLGFYFEGRFHDGWKQYWTNNHFYNNTGGYHYKQSIISAVYNTIAYVAAAWPAEWTGNTEGADPKFVKWWDRSNPDMTPNYALQSSSPLIDAGTWLTKITSPTGSDSTAPYTFTVADAGYFCDGWTIPGVTGDTIKLQNGQERTITAINYATNQITVNSSVSWTQGMGVALDYEGTKPDIGAKEYGGGGTDTQAPGSPSGLIVR